MRALTATMLKFIGFLFAFGAVSVYCQNWQTNSYVLNHEQFFGDVMEETIMELERREWCNLKLDNIYQTISDSLYNFLVNGTVLYSNGFLISVQRIDVVQVQQLITAWTSGGVTSTTATVRGNLNLNDAMVGFDVEATLYNDGEVSVQRYTGTFNYLLAQLQFAINKNLDTGAVSVSSSLLSLTAASGVRMIYMPANNVTEALSRRWILSNNFSSIGRWGSAVMVPIIQNITSTTMPFPDICIGCNA